MESAPTSADALLSTTTPSRVARGGLAFNVELPTSPAVRPSPRLTRLTTPRTPRTPHADGDTNGLAAAASATNGLCDENEKPQLTAEDLMRKLSDAANRRRVRDSCLRERFTLLLLSAIFCSFRICIVILRHAEGEDWPGARQSPGYPAQTEGGGRRTAQEARRGLGREEREPWLSSEEEDWPSQWLSVFWSLCLTRNTIELYPTIFKNFNRNQ